MVFDYLNDVIMIHLKDNPEEMKKIKVKNTPLTQAFCDAIDNFTDEFVTGFFQNIL